MWKIIGKRLAILFAVTFFLLATGVINSNAQTAKMQPTTDDYEDSDIDPGYLEYVFPEDSEDSLTVQVAAMGIGAKSETGKGEAQAVFEMRFENLSQTDSVIPVDEFRARDSKGNRSGKPVVQSGKKTAKSPVQVGPGETRILSLSFPFSKMSLTDGPRTLYLSWKVQLGRESYKEKSEFNPYDPPDFEDVEDEVEEDENAEEAHNTYNTYNTYNSYSNDGCACGPYGYCPRVIWVHWWWYRPYVHHPHYHRGWWHRHHRHHHHHHRSRDHWKHRHRDDRYHGKDSHHRGNRDNPKDRDQADHSKPRSKVDSYKEKPRSLDHSPGLSTDRPRKTNTRRKDSVRNSKRKAGKKTKTNSAFSHSSKKTNSGNYQSANNTSELKPVPTSFKSKKSKAKSKKKKSSSKKSKKKKSKKKK